MIECDLLGSSKLGSLSPKELEAPLKNVARGVRVTIDHESAAVATVYTVTQRLSNGGAAAGTALRGAVRRNSHDSTTSFFRFVRQHVAKRCPTCVMLVSSQSFRSRGVISTLEKLDHVQIFDADGAVFLNELATDSIKLRFACAHQSLVMPREVADGFVATTRVKHTSIFSTLSFSHLVLQPLEGRETSENRTSVGRDQFSHADVESDRRRARRKCSRRRYLASQHCVVSIGLSANRARLWLSERGDILPRLPTKSTDVREVRAALIDSPVHVGMRKRIVPPHGLEARQADAFAVSNACEESFVREVHTPNHVLQDGSIHDAELGPVVFHRRQLVLLIHPRDSFVRRAIGFAPLLQRGVVQLTAVHQPRVNQRGLSFRRVQAKLVGANQQLVGTLA